MRSARSPSRRSPTRLGPRSWTDTTTRARPRSFSHHASSACPFASICPSPCPFPGLLPDLAMGRDPVGVRGRWLRRRLLRGIRPGCRCAGDASGAAALGPQLRHDNGGLRARPAHRARPVPAVVRPSALPLNPRFLQGSCSTLAPASSAARPPPWLPLPSTRSPPPMPAAQPPRAWSSKSGGRRRRPQA